MMELSRRNALKGGAALTVSRGAKAVAGEAAALIVYDSRSPASNLFAKGAGFAIDVASQETQGWRAMRSHLPTGHILGLTSWSNYVLARGYAEEQGKRLLREEKMGKLIRWEMS